MVTAPPDGYTILLVNPANGINASLYKKRPFNFIRDIAPVAGIVRTPNVMTVTNSLPVKTVAEFIAYCKANPGKVKSGLAALRLPAQSRVVTLRNMLRHGASR